MVKICRAGGKRAGFVKSGAPNSCVRRPVEPQTHTERDTMAQAVMDPDRCGVSPRNSSGSIPT